MKKVLALVLFAAALTACDKSELEEANKDYEILIAKEKEKDFKLFNDKLKGSKGEDVPQNTQPKPTQQ